MSHNIDITAKYKQVALAFRSYPKYVHLPVVDVVLKNLSTGEVDLFAREFKIDTGADITFINGKLVGEAPYVNGKLNGIVKTYYDNGQLYTVDAYIDSVRNGISKGYYKDGKLYYETTYTNGVEGILKLYDDKGHEIKQ